MVYEGIWIFFLFAAGGESVLEGKDASIFCISKCLENIVKFKLSQWKTSTIALNNDLETTRVTDSSSFCSGLNSSVV